VVHFHIVCELLLNIEFHKSILWLCAPIHWWYYTSYQTMRKNDFKINILMKNT
jgi:hypothetical protein